MFIYRLNKPFLKLHNENYVGIKINSQEIFMDMEKYNLDLNIICEKTSYPML